MADMTDTQAEHEFDTAGEALEHLEHLAQER